MALTAAQLEAILTLDKSQFERALGQVHQTTQKAGQGLREWGAGVGKAINDGVVLATTGAAGFAATVTAVGVEYNALQQSSRAALDTILGGMDKANAQMDELNEFASNSPFARDVFIKAQQQLLGFGQEAERVVPTLSAIQDAVAATGGSNEDIAELVRIIAQLEGGVKLSAETLNQFGTRGIDAAGIIGDAMGKTAETIRTEITEGTLDADEAIVALTDGMTERFGGAAANVKETWDGATDRIKAATRDIGAEIARPFVDPMGGGRAIDWANQFADVLRAVERQVPNVVTVLDARLTPAFDNFSITMKDAVDTIDGWDASDLEGILDRLGQHTPAIAGLSAAMFTLATSNIPVIGGLTSALGPLPAALGAAALASPGMRDGLGDILEAGEPLVGVLGDLAGMASGTFSTALEGAGTILGGVAEVIGPVVEWFSDLPEPIRNAATAALIFNAAGGPTSKILEDITTGARNFAGGISGAISSFDPWKGRFEGAAADALTFRTKLQITKDEAGGFGGMIRNVAGDLGDSARTGLRGALNGVMGIFGGPWGMALMGATAAITLWAQENQKAKARADELAASLDQQTGAFTEASEAIVTSQLLEALDDDALGRMAEQMETYGLSAADVTTAILDQGEAYDALRQKIIDKHLELEHSEENAAKLAEQSEVLEYIDEQIEAHQLEKEAIQAVHEAEKERRAAMDEGERSHYRYTEAIQVAVDETINMNDRVRALKDALDELNGVSKTQEERARDLADTQRDLAGFFEDNAEAIGDMDEALIDMSTGLPSHTELGNDLNRILQNMGDDAHDAALSIYDLAEAEGWSTEKTQEAIEEAYEPYIETLQDLETQGYLTKDEVDALTSSIIGVPEITSFIITHNDTITTTEKELLSLISEIESIPEGEAYITDKDSIEHLLDDLEGMEYEIENLDDGEVKITPIGIPDAVAQIEENLINRDWSTTVTVHTMLTGKTPAQRVKEAREGGRGWGIVAPRYYGGIDVKGMAAGGLTGPSVMDVAQFVKPGDIRFAGDRSDVDEAWIPLDGSPRSVAILQEAIHRMPNFEPEGMFAGGVTGNITPPQVEAVDGPDTSELQAVWEETMQVLADSTRDTFDTIEQDTAQSQGETTRITADNLAAMQSVTAQELGVMVATIATNMSAMQDDTTRHTAAMRNVTGREFLTMQQTGANLAALLHTQAAAEFQALHADGAREAQALRADSNQEFTAMQTHGVDAAGELRAGIVSEIGAAKTPFTGGVNDLVQVMREFSDAITDAYGDMGVTIGKPNRISAWTGGILPGYNPGVDNHTFTSPTGGILELSGGEGISRPEVVQAMGADTFNALNAAARSSGVAGVQRMLTGLIPRRAFSDGGILDDFSGDAKAIGAEYKNLLPDNWLRPAGRSIIDTVVDGIGGALASFASGVGWVRPTAGRITSRYGPRGGGWHAGMDIAGGAGTPTYAPTFGRVLETGWNIGPGRTGVGSLIELMGGLYTYFGHNSPGGLKVRPGDLVAPGDRVGDQGSTGNVTGPHLHWEIHKGKPWNDINPHPFWDAAGAGGSAVNMPGGGNDMWTGIITQALRLVGLPTTPAYVNAWLRQGQTESGLNPRAVQRVHDINSVMGNHARGIVQVIPPTFAAYSLPGMKDIFNPLHNFAAGMNYAKNRYGVTGMLNVIGKGHGYEHGTEHALPGWAWVGEAGPELVRFRGGETVLNHQDSIAAVSGGLTDRQIDRLATKLGKVVADEVTPMLNVTVENPGGDARSAMREVTKVFRREFGQMAGV